MAELILHAPDFGKRLREAVANNSDVPPPNHGRLGWIVGRMERKGQKVTEETVRRWLLGHVKPRDGNMRALAEVLNANYVWLSTGHSIGLTQEETKVRDPDTEVAIKLVSGFVQMDGGRLAYPQAGDKRAAEALRARFKSSWDIAVSCEAPCHEPDTCDEGPGG